MVAITRKPLQGVLNILRFNWHFYLLAALVTAFILWANPFLPLWLTAVALAIMVYVVVMSLAASCYIYDFSGFYSLAWIDQLAVGEPKSIVNINAGFDETSAIIQSRFPQAALTVLDFYDSEKHTEVSIKRAREKYAAYPGTIATATNKIPVADAAADIVFLIFAAHEIRDFSESEILFGELHRILEEKGKIVLVEHLRDAPNFFAYTIGFFHFFPRRRWLKLVDGSGLKITAETKLTPFTTLFLIEKNGNTS